MKPITTALLAACLAALPTGCASESEPAPDTTKPTAQVAVPPNLFATSAPPGAVPLVDAKATAKTGDTVVFEARVGGRIESFVPNRAVFFVADPSILSCDQIHGDSCKTPWDYCCEPPDNLRKHMATVQVVDDSGQPLKLSLHEKHGLEPLKTVYVTGVVEQVDAAGTFVVNAETIHVKESS